MHYGYIICTFAWSQSHTLVPLFLLLALPLANMAAAGAKGVSRCKLMKEMTFMGQVAARSATRSITMREARGACGDLWISPEIGA